MEHEIELKRLKRARNNREKNQGNCFENSIQHDTSKEEENLEHDET